MYLGFVAVPDSPILNMSSYRGFAILVIIVLSGYLALDTDIWGLSYLSR